MLRASGETWGGTGEKSPTWYFTQSGNAINVGDIRVGWLRRLLQPAGISREEWIGE